MEKSDRTERTNTFVLIQNIPSSFIISMRDPLGAWHAGIHESKQD